MAVSCEPADLVTAAKCLDRCIPDGQKMAVLIYLFCQVADMNCDPKSLVSASLCLDRCIPDGQKMAVLIYLACQLAAAGGVTPSGSVQVYVGRAPAPPDDPTKGAVSYPVGGGSLSQWDVLTQAWV